MNCFELEDDEGLPDYQKILGIISVINVEDNEEDCLTNLILGCKLEQTENNSNSKLLPYPVIKYSIKNGKPEFTFFKLTT